MPTENIQIAKEVAVEPVSSDDLTRTLRRLERKLRRILQGLRDDSIAALAEVRPKPNTPRDFPCLVKMLDTLDEWADEIADGARDFDEVRNALEHLRKRATIAVAKQ